jgi:catechol 2,3-dioxygenase-like lactoylglutathione lyase family enzyme
VPAPPLPHADALRGAVGRRFAKKVEPQRLSHVLLFTSSVDRQLALYRDVLGLGLSDRSRDGIAFMHGRSGSDHHLVAFGKSTRSGFHHVAWDVPTVEDVGLGWMQMQRAGYSRVWGPGRHVLGSNYFCYVEDPWGSFCEYSADIDYVEAGSQWPADDHEPEDSLYLWGPPTPSNFLDNTDAER